METPERLQYALLCNSEETRDLKCKVQKEKKLVKKKQKKKLDMKLQLVCLNT